MLTQAEQKALDYIAGYIHDNGGVSPTYREIMHCMGWRTKGQIGFLQQACREGPPAPPEQAVAGARGA